VSTASRPITKRVLPYLKTEIIKGKIMTHKSELLKKYSKEKMIANNNSNNTVNNFGHI
jgi:hypothetical protein